MIYKLKDDKIKAIISTPSAEQLRIKLLKLYLTEKDNMGLLEDTILTANQFVRNQYGIIG